MMPTRALLTAITWLATVQACQGLHSYQTVNVSLRNSETFEYPTVGGDEDGAMIVTQASHFSISEIRHGPETNWVAVYVYQPAAGFVGSDAVELEIHTGSDGASPPTSIKHVTIRFAILD